MKQDLQIESLPANDSAASKVGDLDARSINRRFSISSIPWRGRKSQFFPKGYRATFITIWHEDPMDFTGKCRGRSDDSCGWYTPPHEDR